MKRRQSNLTFLSRVDSLRDNATFDKVPVHGWIRAIREGLGLTATQLGHRLSITQPSVVALEASEAAKTIRLSSLERVAAALNCTLAYALIPNESLEEAVHSRVNKLAEERLRRVEHTMLLENQSVTDPTAKGRLLSHIEDEIEHGSIWDD
jgi:predicted DNA-binding mobile mystery protein A